MRTSNIKLLNEIDILENNLGIDSESLELVKRINKLESKTLVFFMAQSKVSNLFFRERDSAIKFISEQSVSSGFTLVATTFADS